LLEYFFAGFRPHKAEESFRRAIAALPPNTDEEIDIIGFDHIPTGPLQLPDNLVALLNFGRSGTGLLHSLLDNHPEISTLPGMFLRDFFDAGFWNKIAAEGWRRLPERFADEFAVLFDSNSSKPLPGGKGSYVGKGEGMTTLGENRNEALSFDRKKFCSEALRLMMHFDKVDPGLFLLIAHAVFEKAANAGKHTVFYHIHSPDDYATLNFLRYHPESRLIMMVREPIQSCESWVCGLFEKNKYEHIVHRIIKMLFDIDQVPFRTQDSVGIRLEDLKTRPEATIRSICEWMGINETPSLYRKTARGKKWWGDPSSPYYDKKKDMLPFDETSIKRPIGKVFSEMDQLILRTRFYPFRVQFGYTEPDPSGFKKSLMEIRPLLDDMLDFEKVIVERSKIDPDQFKRSRPYLFLRAGLMDRWEVLNEFKNYPHMLPPLDVAVE